jgi:hypothetical protein
MRPFSLATHTTCVLSCLSVLSCGIRNVAPPPSPAPNLPSVNALVPHVEGAQPVVLDVVGRAAQVEEVEHIDLQVENGVAKIAPTQTKSLCVTPCEVNLSAGSHLLRFTDSASATDLSSYANVEVGQVPVAFRYAEGEYRTHPTLQGLATGLIATGIPIGLLSLPPLFLGMSGAISDQGVNNGLKVTGETGIGIGLTFIVAAVVLKVLGQDTYQPGSSTQWALAPMPIPPKREVASEAPPPPPLPPPPPPPSPPLPQTWGGASTNQGTAGIQR